MKGKGVLRSAIWLVFLLTAAGGQALALPALWSDNGHYYEAVSVPSGITWDDAKAASESMTYMGMQGHLATITSQAENDFIVQALGGPFFLNGYFLGGFQPAGSPEPGGNWQWVTGEAWEFTNWAMGEPNNEYSGGAILHPSGNWGNISEEVLHFYHGQGQWNDVPHDSGWGGYIVEYEPSPATAPVPEPSTMMLLGAGLVVLSRFRRIVS